MPSVDRPVAGSSDRTVEDVEEGAVGDVAPVDAGVVDGTPEGDELGGGVDSGGMVGSEGGTEPVKVGVTGGADDDDGATVVEVLTDVDGVVVVEGEVDDVVPPWQLAGRTAPPPSAPTQ
jgi:hypothetical protein